MAAPTPTVGPFTAFVTYLSTKTNYTIGSSLAINLLNAGINLAIMIQKVLALRYDIVCRDLSGRKCFYERDGAYAIAFSSGALAATLMVFNFWYYVLSTDPITDADQQKQFKLIRTTSLISLVLSGAVLFLISVFSSDVKIDPTFYAALVVSIVEATRNLIEANSTLITAAKPAQDTSIATLFPAMKATAASHLAAVAAANDAAITAARRAKAAANAAVIAAANAVVDAVEYEANESAHQRRIARGEAAVAAAAETANTAATNLANAKVTAVEAVVSGDTRVELPLPLSFSGVGRALLLRNMARDGITKAVALVEDSVEAERVETVVRQAFVAAITSANNIAAVAPAEAGPPVPA